jgi:hypothetical protein
MFPIHCTYSTVIDSIGCEVTNNTMFFYWSINAHSDVALGTHYRYTMVCLMPERLLSPMSIPKIAGESI